MIGSIVQNAIALMDSLFLFYLGEDDFAAIGFVSAFYLIIISVGYGFSRGGQIVMARQDGGSQFRRIGISFNTNLVMLIVLATIFFFIVRYASPWFLKFLVSNEVIYEKSVEYLQFRSWGVYTGYLGLGMVALYTGVSNTGFLVIATVVLLGTNLFFNYGLIFGNFGMPQMGIGGAALASNIAELAGFISFAIHVLISKDFKIFHIPSKVVANYRIARDILKISMPLVLQTSAGVLSWFVLFTLVENMGQRELAISNLARVFYLILSIPLWGFSVSVNTMVSNAMGSRKYEKILVIIKRTSLLTLIITFTIAIPLLLKPEFFVNPLLNDEQMEVLYQAKGVLRLLLGIFVFYILGTIFFQGMIGTGKVLLTLTIQLLSVGFYISLLLIGVKLLGFNMVQAWALEILYWIAILVCNLVYFKFYFKK
ncbi:MATE family efflux transporter [Membranihabitans maritimus]|uniref:MATE family efflux transporter n=1 Tax=Membranihabitans maritimus TaxID=2904244 RepID=UPI001F1F9CB0|nr:MATE family efflux transporter [Membranihabitans maritimus]